VRWCCPFEGSGSRLAVPDAVTGASAASWSFLRCGVLICEGVPGSIGFPDPVTTSTFLPRPTVFPPRRPPKFDPRVHPPVRSVLPWSASSRARPTRVRAWRLPWGFIPLGDVNQKSPLTRASQSRFVPSATFRTSSTVFSSSGLAGLFHPAATSGIRSPGVFPSDPAARALRPCVTLAPFESATYRGCPRRQRHPLDLRASVRAGVRCRRVGV
jgi:hypothetical protein